MTGERLGQAGWLSPSEVGSQGPEAEAGFTSSSGGVRALSVNAKKGLSGEERLETVPNRVNGPGKFRAWASRSYPEGMRLLLCISTGGRLWRSPEGGQPNEIR